MQEYSYSVPIQELPGELRPLVDKLLSTGEATIRDGYVLLTWDAAQKLLDEARKKDIQITLYEATPA